MASKKSIKRKKTVGSLIKFLKNRKSAGLVLGVCLAVAGSAYVATAKFSASGNSDEKWKENSKVTYSVRVQNSNGELLENALVWIDSSNDFDAAAANGPHSYSMGSVSMGKTDSHGIASKEFKICEKGKARRACYKNKDNKLMLIGKLTPKVVGDDGAKEIMKSAHFFAGSTTNNATITIKLKKGATAGKVVEGSAKSKSQTKSAEKVPAKGPAFNVNVNGPDGKPVGAGVKVTFNFAADKKISPSTSTTNSKGAAKLNYKITVCSSDSKNICASDGKNKISKIDLAVKNAKGEDILAEPHHFAGSTIKDAVITIKLKEIPKVGVVAKASSSTKAAASKVKTAVKSAASKVTRKGSGAKVNTTPTTKDKVTFSESLPANKTNLEKTLNLQLKNSSGQPISGTVKITIVYKECTSGGCGGASGDQFKQESFNVTSQDGTKSFKFGVVNVPQTKRSLFTGKTTNLDRYFFYYGQTNKLVRRVYISDVNDGNKKEINIGGYPFATKALSSAEKFQLRTYTYYSSGTLPPANSTSTQSSPTTEVIGTVQYDGNGPTDPEAAGRPAGN